VQKDDQGARVRRRACERGLWSPQTSPTL
jgi:hypothetical protein